MKCFYPRNIRELGAGSAVIIYLLFFPNKLCQKARRGPKHSMEMASTLILGDAANEETFLYLSRQKLLYNRITQTATETSLLHILRICCRFFKA